MTTPLEIRAMHLAVSLHAEQMHGWRPYIWHLADTVGWLRYVNITQPEILAAAWLHDALEDTAATPQVITETTTDRVTQLVRAVTDNPGDNRNERKKGVLKRIRRAGWEAVAIKVADRLSNVAGCQHVRQTGFQKKMNTPYRQRSLLQMYRQEQLEFAQELHRHKDPEEVQKLWMELNPRVAGL